MYSQKNMDVFSFYTFNEQDKQHVVLYFHHQQEDILSLSMMRKTKRKTMFVKYFLKKGS